LLFVRRDPHVPRDTHHRRIRERVTSRSRHAAVEAPRPAVGVNHIIAGLQEGVRPEDQLERERDTVVGLDAGALELRPRVRRFARAQDKQTQARARQPAGLLRRVVLVNLDDVDDPRWDADAAGIARCEVTGGRLGAVQLVRVVASQGRLAVPADTVGVRANLPPGPADDERAFRRRR